jgi:hypothetical protein
MILELVTVVEINLKDLVPKAENLRFRVEVFGDSETPRRYFARLLRWDLFRMRPFDRQDAPSESHEDILVLDRMWDPEEHPHGTPQDAVDFALRRIQEQIRPGSTR